jgi:hypothetical protein
MIYMVLVVLTVQLHHMFKKILLKHRYYAINFLLHCVVVLASLEVNSADALQCALADAVHCGTVESHSADTYIPDDIFRVSFFSSFFQEQPPVEHILITTTLIPPLQHTE